MSHTKTFTNASDYAAFKTNVETKIGLTGLPDPAHIDFTQPVAIDFTLLATLFSPSFATVLLGLP